MSNKQQILKQMFSSLQQKISISQARIYLVFFMGIPFLTGCTHRSPAQPMTEARAILTAQQTIVNHAPNYVYAPQGFYQSRDHEFSGIEPESIATTDQPS